MGELCCFLNCNQQPKLVLVYQYKNYQQSQVLESALNLNPHQFHVLVLTRTQTVITKEIFSNGILIQVSHKAILWLYAVIPIPEYRAHTTLRIKTTRMVAKLLMLSTLVTIPSVTPSASTVLQNVQFNPVSTIPIWNNN